MGDLRNVINIGEVTERELEEVGIFTLEELKKTGAFVAWLKIKNNSAHKDISICHLYALEGAVLGVRWHGIPNKKALKKKAEDFFK